jgi:lipoprotein signal peptidase
VTLRTGLLLVGLIGGGGAILDRILKVNASLQSSGIRFGPGDFFVYGYFPNRAFLGVFEVSQSLALGLTLLLLVLIATFVVLAVRARRVAAFLGASFILLGGFSNAFDRLTTGAVVDYFSLTPFFGAFNLADGLILAGSLVLVFGAVRRTTRSSPV